MTEIIRPCAAVSIVKPAHHLLVVWNTRYGGWTLPGGKVEDNETLEDGQARELEEETGLMTTSRTLVYEGPTGGTEAADRGRHVYLFAVQAKGEPWQAEMDRPVGWMSPTSFLKFTPFRDFYEKAFSTIDISKGAPWIRKRH
jgi:ADP-ribose pyrophosphatase YjhB (NUDIX family)